LAQVFPLSATVEDPGLAGLVRSGWHPAGVPRLAADRENRVDAEIDFAAIDVHYATPETIDDPVYAVPDPADWTFVMNDNGQPLLLGGASAHMRLAASAPEAAPVELVVGVAGFRRGTLRVACRGEPVGTVDIDQPGQTTELRLQVRDPRGAPLAFSFEPTAAETDAGTAPYGVIRLRSRRTDGTGSAVPAAP
jgi:hypothetical protein